MNWSESTINDLFRPSLFSHSINRISACPWIPYPISATQGGSFSRAQSHAFHEPALLTLSYVPVPAISSPASPVVTQTCAPKDRRASLMGLTTAPGAPAVPALPAPLALSTELRAGASTCATTMSGISLAMGTR